MILDRRLTSVLLFVGFAIFFPVALHAQTGSLTGEVRDAQTDAPLPGCTIRVTLMSDTTVTHATFSNSKGKYRFSALASGDYRLSFNLLGYKHADGHVKISDDDATSVEMTLKPEVLPGGDLVVTASRQEEKVNEAPASISVVNARQVAVLQSPTVTHLFAAVPGMDISQEGVFAESFSSRSASSVYSSDMYTMIDNRSLSVPGIGGYFGILMPISNFDIDHIEVVRGPGAALYGPGASEGVAHIITRSPFSSQGTALSLSGGERDYMDAQLRHAMSFGDKFAFKVSGTYRKVHDWEYVDSAEVADRNIVMNAAKLGPQDTTNFFDTVHVGHRRPDAEFYTLDARADYVLGENALLMVNGGTTKILEAVQMTSAAGAAQVDGWSMGYGQARMTYGDLFLEGYYQKVNTQNSYILRTGDPVAEASSTTGFQAQHHYHLGNSELLTYGADYMTVSPTNDLAYGLNSGKVKSNVVGGYVQSKTTLVDNILDLTLAARVDKQTEIKDMLFSPRAALVAHVGEDGMHTIRAMYNQTVTPPGVDYYYYDLDYAHNIYGPLTDALGLKTQYDLRLEGTHLSGSHFSMTNGSYMMYSAFTELSGADPRTTAIPVNGAVDRFWPILLNIGAQGLKAVGLSDAMIQAFTQIKAPKDNDAVVNSRMAALQLDQTFAPVAGPTDIPEVKPQGHQVLELDYQVKVTDAMQLEIDGYRSHYDNYPSARAAITPNVFADAGQLESYLAAQLVPIVGAQQAPLLAHVLSYGYTDGTGHHAGLSEAPLGTVSPDGSSRPLDVLFGIPAYYGNVNYYGIDFTTALKVSDRIAIDGGLSLVSKNQFTPDDSTLGTIYLNIPKYKASLGFHYTGIIEGLNADVKYRWYDAFTMQSGVAYFGNVAARNLLDLTLTYTPASFQDLQFVLAVTNLLDYRHEEFVGAPYIGRFTTLKASYTLPSL